MLTLLACNEPCLLVVEVLSLESGIALYLIVTFFNQKNASLGDTASSGPKYLEGVADFWKILCSGKERVRDAATLREKPDAETTWRGEGTRLESEDLRSSTKRKKKGPLFSMTYVEPFQPASSNLK